ncbi:MAG: DUF58 domain-containing protein [Gammaproteobacteria bacterium]
MAQQAHRLTTAAGIDEARLRRFARLAIPFLAGGVSEGIGPRSARDRPGPGMEFLDLRPYAPGEDVRHIDWRQTARRGRTLVRRYRDESAADWVLALDGSASMALGRKWPMTRELSLGLGYALLQAGHRVSLLIFAGRVRARLAAGRGPRQFAALVRELDAWQPPVRGGGSAPGACAAYMRRSGRLFLVSDFLREDAMAPDLRQLRAGVASGEALQVLARGEIAAAPGGTVRLRDVEGGETRDLVLSPEETAAAESRLARHTARVSRVAARVGLRFSACRDDEDWERVLLRHLGL